MLSDALPAVYAEPLVYLVVWLGSLLIAWIFIASAVRNGVLSALRKDRWEVWRDQQKARATKVSPTRPVPPPDRPQHWPEPGEQFVVVDDVPEDEP